MKKNVIILVGIFVVVIAVVFGGIMLTKNFGKDTAVVETEDATKNVQKQLSKINVTTSEPVKAPIELDEDNDAEELPDIDTCQLTVPSTTSLYAEIFATGEKSGNGKDGWLNEVAEKFNQEGVELNGQKVSVAIRQVSSGLGYDYIRTGKYIPDGYSPSNDLYVKMLQNSGVEIDMISEKLVSNTPGMLLSNEKYDELTKKYGSINLKSVVEAVSNGEIIMGYTNPYTSGTGLNFLISTLITYDSSNPLSETAVSGFQTFQKNIPYVAVTTQQMAISADKGSFDGFITEYQTYENQEAQKRKYKFIPFGYMHNNPLISSKTVSGEKKEILKLFADYAADQKNQELATSYGFNAELGYMVEQKEVDGSTLASAQELWKTEKDSGQDIIAVFIADNSGSMSGAPLNALKESLVNGMKYIKDNNYIGLVSYSDGVTLEVPIRQFDMNQKAYFQGAVQRMTADGMTATYDALVVASDMLIKAKETNPDARAMIFLLSDGDENGSITSFSNVTSNIGALKFPVYTIGYNANIDALGKLSEINEAATINANTDDVVYQIKNLFNSSL